MMEQPFQVAFRVDRKSGDLQFCHRHASDTRSGETQHHTSNYVKESIVQYQCGSKTFGKRSPIQSPRCPFTRVVLWNRGASEVSQIGSKAWANMNIMYR